MPWNYVESSRKYTRQAQDGPNRLWIGTRIGRPIFSTLIGCLWKRTSQIHRKIHYFWRWIVQFYQQHINARKIDCRYGDLFRDIFVCLALLSMSDFRVYVCELGTSWFWYIKYKLSSPNAGTCRTRIFTRPPMPVPAYINNIMSPPSTTPNQY